MKKYIILFFSIISFSFSAEIGEYNSNFGIGVGLGFPTGYEFKGIYRQNEWLSLSLNYNILAIDGIVKRVSDSDKSLDITGGVTFSTPGILVNYHPFGGNFRVAGGFLYDIGGLNIDVDGTVKIEGVTAPVTGNVSVKLGRTYPYVGIAYGYDYNSVIHLDFNLGVYFVKRPDVDLYFNIGDSSVVQSILNNIGGLTAQQKSDIISLLESSGGNILNLPEIVAEVAGISGLTMPSEASLENDIVSSIQEGYSYLPEIMGYSLLPVVSVGFVFFPF